MATVVEIDEAGRIVVPKKLRDALHLTPGAKLKVERAGDALMLMPSSSEAQLVIENGASLIFPADRSHAPILTNEIVNELIAQCRLAQERQMLAPDLAGRITTP